MTREEAIHKMKYSKRAYQMLIDEKVQEGVLVGKGINAEWSADTPIIDAYKDMLEACDMAIKALEQETCEDEYIKVPKKALKYRTAGMVAYNAEWLKSHFDIERAAICGVQDPCEVEAVKQAYSKGFEDCRQAVLDKKELVELEDGQSFHCISPEDVETLSPVTPEPKMGRWIDDGIYADGWSHKVFHCSECGHNILGFKDDLKIECPNCGAKMSEVKE